jgi:post-segregation antitoxin (ccd killing protein)
MWHNHAMTRLRVSTTVDQALLEEARAARAGLNDAGLLDEALTALLQKHRRAEIDAAYAAYDEHPLSEPDAWGDLEAFLNAAGRE